MRISIIVAAGLNGEIGRNNQLLWHLPADMRHFKQLTTGHHILMGRKTYDSIGRPLPNRTNIIVTRSQSFSPEGCIIVQHVDKGVEWARKNGETELFVIGGGQVYREVLPLADTIYFTRVQASFPDADTFFPFSAGKDWQIVSEEKYPADERHQYPFEFIVYQRK